MKPLWIILSGAIIGILAGVGGFQIAIAGTVSTHGTKIDVIEKQFDQEKNRTDARIFAVTEIVNRTLDQNREFITLLREQNAIYKQMLLNGKDLK